MAKRLLLSRVIGRNWARITYGRYIEPFWLHANQVDIGVLHLDPRLVGLRILQLSDFHMSHRMPASHVRGAVEKANHFDCDLIALTGDFVHAGFTHVDAIADILSALRARLGVYAVLGNHDHAIRFRGRKSRGSLSEAITRALTSAGMTVLMNEHRILDHRGGRLAVAGIDDLWSGQADLDAALRNIPADVPRLVLAHNPYSIAQAAGQRVDLMLSGHTHGGQIRTERFGRPMLDWWGRAPLRLHSGLYYHDSGSLYVNNGLGFGLPFRYKVRPEIAVFRLVRLEQEGKLNAL